MADFAFLRAMYLFRHSSKKVFYIRFQSPKDKEINAIALGNFPKRGCLIVDPGSDRTFIWQGTVADTDEVTHCTDYKIIVSSESKEIRKKLFEEIKSLEKHGQEESRKVIKKDVEEIRKSHQKFQQALPDGFKSPIHKV